MATIPKEFQEEFLKQLAEQGTFTNPTFQGEIFDHQWTFGNNGQYQYSRFKVENTTGTVILDAEEGEDGVWRVPEPEVDNDWKFIGHITSLDGKPFVGNAYFSNASS